MLPVASGVSFDEIAWLRANSPAWRLLRADNAPLVLSFLHRVFVEENVRSIPATELASRLDDELYALNERDAEELPQARQGLPGRLGRAGVRLAAQVLPRGQRRAALRRDPGGGEGAAVGARLRRARLRRHRVPAEHGLRPAPPDRLRHRDGPAGRGSRNCGASSARSTRRSPASRQATRSCSTRAASATATSSSPRPRGSCCADFRQVEENFRKLDRQLREKVTGWQGGKGELLDDVLGSRESITGSDQGRSFQAFHDFLLSQPRQEELAGSARPGPRARRGNADATRGCATSTTTGCDAAEARPGDGAAAVRAAEEVPRRPGVVREPAGDRPAARHRGPRAQACGTRSDGRPHDGDRRDAARGQAADGAAALHPVSKPRIDSNAIRPAGRRRRDRPAALFEQVYVDPGPLRGNVRAALRRARRSASPTWSGRGPLTHGVAELVAYLSLRDDAFTIVYDETSAEQVSWTGLDGKRRTATLPRVTFTRWTGTREGASDDRARPVHLAVIPLMKGVVYRDTHDRAWKQLLQLQPQVRDYVEVLGLQVVIDEAEGYAFLRQRPADEDGDRSAAQADPAPFAVLPRQPAARAAAQEARRVRRPGRRHAADAHPRADRRDAPRLPAGDEQRGAPASTRSTTHINKADRARLPARRPRTREPVYEVRRILKAFVDGQWLADFDARLAEYAAALTG